MLANRLIGSMRYEQLSCNELEHSIHCSSMQRYNNILVPSGLRDSDNSALSLGAGLAISHEARLTVLHVRSVRDEGPSFHWLDGVVRVHQALIPPPSTNTQGALVTIEGLSKQLGQFVFRHIPEQIRTTLDLHCYFAQW
jgi:hypothetical protein